MRVQFGVEGGRKKKGILRKCQAESCYVIATAVDVGFKITVAQGPEQSLNKVGSGFLVLMSNS